MPDLPPPSALTWSERLLAAGIGLAIRKTLFATRLSPAVQLAPGATDYVLVHPAALGHPAALVRLGSMLARETAAQAR